MTHSVLDVVQLSFSTFLNRELHLYCIRYKEEKFENPVIVYQEGNTFNDFRSTTYALYYFKLQIGLDLFECSPLAIDLHGWMAINDHTSAPWRISAQIF